MERKTNADSNIVFSTGDSNFAKNRLISQAIDSSTPTSTTNRDSEPDQRSRRLGSRVDRGSKAAAPDWKAQFEQF